ncbi:MAG: hypothetical protein AABW47_03595 [Nanoarchaeota archaeon]
MKKCIDLVISGCDFSGTTTQLSGIMDFLLSQGFKIRDLRGTEIDALFHSESMIDFNWKYVSLYEFLHDERVHPFIISEAKNMLNRLTLERIKISSMVHNEITEYIDPDSADVWIMEEPTRRGAGQTARGFELYRSQFGSEVNPITAALAHQAYRSEEFFRFRKVLRENRKIIIRSRSEESACYQIRDEQTLPNGILKNQYLELPGHQIAFGNTPTHIFLAVGPDN